MKLKFSIIICLLLVTAILAGYTAMNKLDSYQKSASKSKIASAHIFSHFEKNTRIETEVVNALFLSETYPSVTIKKGKEDLMVENEEIYKNRYNVYYQIAQPNKQVIDVTLNVSKHLNKTNIEIQNVAPKTPIYLTDGSITLRHKILTDWSGKVEINDIKTNKICVVMGIVNNASPEFCHIINTNNGGANA